MGVLSSNGPSAVPLGPEGFTGHQEASQHLVRDEHNRLNIVGSPAEDETLMNGNLFSPHDALLNGEIDEDEAAEELEADLAIGLKPARVAVSGILHGTVTKSPTASDLGFSTIRDGALHVESLKTLDTVDPIPRTPKLSSPLFRNFDTDSGAIEETPSISVAAVEHAVSTAPIDWAASSFLGPPSTPEALNPEEPSKFFAGLRFFIDLARPGRKDLIKRVKVCSLHRLR